METFSHQKKNKIKLITSSIMQSCQAESHDLLRAWFSTKTTFQIFKNLVDGCEKSWNTQKTRRQASKRKGRKSIKKNPTQNEFNFPSLLPSLRCVYMRSHHSAVESFPFRRLTKLETFEHGKRSGARADELLLNSVDFPSTKSSCSTKSTSANPWDATE